MSGVSNRAGADQFAALLGQTVPLRVKIHAAPLEELSRGPLMMAVLPSADSATEWA